MKAPTIYDVATRAGVSKSLVSLVLRGSDQVSTAKREAVLEAVQELNYTPSSLAAGLAGARTRSIGVIVDEFENLWFPPVLSGLRSAFKTLGFSLSVADRALNSHLDLDPLAAFQSQRVEGIIIAGEVSKQAIARLRVPAIILGTRSIKAPQIPVIAGDEVAGGQLATSHLLDLGHHNIVCVSARGASAKAREAGYEHAMREANLTPFILRAENTTEAAAREVVKTALQSSGANVAQPTAIFAVNDPMAVGAIGALREVGLTVPKDVSVIGYDNSPIAAYDLISLTSVSGEPEELGELAGRALLAQIADKHEVESSSLAPQLVRRGSTQQLNTPQRAG